MISLFELFLINTFSLQCFTPVLNILLRGEQIIKKGLAYVVG